MIDMTSADTLALSILAVTQTWTVFTLNRMNSQIDSATDRINRHIEKGRHE